MSSVSDTVVVVDTLVFRLSRAAVIPTQGLLLSKEVRASLSRFVQNVVCGRIRANYIKQNKMHLGD